MEGVGVDSWLQQGREGNSSNISSFFISVVKPDFNTGKRNKWKEEEPHPQQNTKKTLQTEQLKTLRQKKTTQKPKHTKNPPQNHFVEVRISLADILPCPNS